MCLSNPFHHLAILQHLWKGNSSPVGLIRRNGEFRTETGACLLLSVCIWNLTENNHLLALQMERVADGEVCAQICMVAANAIHNAEMVHGTPLFVWAMPPAGRECVYVAHSVRRSKWRCSPRCAHTDRHTHTSAPIHYYSRVLEELSSLPLLRHYSKLFRSQNKRKMAQLLNWTIIQICILWTHHAWSVEHANGRPGSTRRREASLKAYY